ncbi:hypothetical protein [Streptomyces cavernicola]|uniref:Lipoprotein n=1 Tax=Streptomyces cavernicola TaxID=3043613 RepID=A0ABT6SMV1_9ACTN|nr:hypothetical protein [Streptomyces sp. B-S-A6]MDI3408551.1 hypothetical protein [Streptomyces sp. B-S-A6]
MGLAFAGTACTSVDETTPAPAGEEQTAKPPSEAPPEEKSPQGGREATANERDDLKSFGLDDRSQAGFTDIWLTWTITNSSSKKSNYTWDWEALDADGTRGANGTQFEADVQPGQTAQGEFFTTLKTTDVKLNITSFDRTMAP